MKNAKWKKQKIKKIVILHELYVTEASCCTFALRETNL